MAKLKIRSEFYPDRYAFVTASGKVKRGHFCRACGAPLKDELSKKRGYGKRCWKQLPVKIILEIPAGDSETS